MTGYIRKRPLSGNKGKRCASLPKEMPDSTLPYIIYMTSCRQTAFPWTIFPASPLSLLPERWADHVASLEERLTVIPGIATVEDIERLTSENSAIVIMKLSRCTDEIHRCIRLHPEYRYHYFENVGTPAERYLNDSKQIASLRFPYFSLLIIRTGAF